MKSWDWWTVGTFFGGLLIMAAAAGSLAWANACCGADESCCHVKYPLGLSYRPVMNAAGQMVDQLTVVNSVDRVLDHVVVTIDHPTQGRLARFDLGRVPAEARVELPLSESDLDPEAIISLSIRHRPNFLVVRMGKLGKSALLKDAHPEHERLPGPHGLGGPR